MVPIATPAAVLSVLITAKGFAQVSQDLNKVEREMKRTSDSTDKIEKRFSHLDNTVGDFNRTMMGLRNVVGIVKWPALIAGAGGAVQAVGALSAGVVGLTSALAPLAGAGAAAAVGFSALGQAAGVGKLALGDIQKALGGNKKALDALTPTQRAFVNRLKSMQGEFKGLQETAARGMAPGLNAAVKSLQPLLSTLRPIIAGTARAMGDLAAAGGRMVGSWGRDVTTVGKTNTVIIRNMGQAALSLASALKDVVVSAGPLATWMSEQVRTGAKWVAQQVQAGRESGKLAGFLAQTRDVMTTLGHIAANLGVALFNIGKAAAPLGRDLLGVIEQLTQRFREWTGSLQGQNALRQYFDNARPMIMAIGKLVGDLGRALIQISSGPGGAKMAEDLGKMVPVLQQLITQTTAAFGPVVIAALTNIVRLFGQLAGSSGPLTLTVQAIGAVAGGLATLLQWAPGLSTLVVTIAGLAASMKLLTFVVGPLAAAMPIVTGAISVLMDAVAVARINFLAGSSAISAFGSGLAVLGNTIRISPLGALLTLIAGVAAVVLLLSGNQKSAAQSARELAAAWDKERDAARGLRDAELNVKQTKLDLVRATTAEKDAHRAATDAANQYGKNSKQAKDADLAWQQSKLDLRRATNAHRDAIADTTKATNANVAAATTAIEKQKQTIAEDQRRVKSLQQLVTFMQDNGAKTDAIRGKQEQLRAATQKLHHDTDTLSKSLRDVPPQVKSKVLVEIDFESNVAGAISAIAKSVGAAVQHVANAPRHFKGGKVTSPGYFAGEEAPRHPEVILATNPAYRQRNLGLWASAGSMLGVPGFAMGGVAAAREVAGADPWASQQASSWIAPKAKSWGNDQAQKLIAKAQAQAVQTPGGGTLPPGASQAQVAAAMLAAARHILGRPYIYGGGHGAWESPGYDCSGAVSYILHAAGMLSSPMDTIALSNWGLPGGGKYITVGVRGGAGMAGHTMMSFFGHFFESGGSGGGPHWDGSWDGVFPISRHPKGFAKGGTFKGDFGDVPPELLLATNPNVLKDPRFATYEKMFGKRRKFARGGIFNKIPGFAKGGVNGGNVWRVLASQEDASSGSGWTELSTNGNAAAKSGHPHTASHTGGWDFSTLGRMYPKGTLLQIRALSGRRGTWPLTDYGDGSAFAPAIGLTPNVFHALGLGGGQWTVDISLPGNNNINLASGFGRLVAGSGGVNAPGTGGSANVTTRISGGRTSQRVTNPTATSPAATTRTPVKKVPPFKPTKVPKLKLPFKLPKGLDDLVKTIKFTGGPSGGVGVAPVVTEHLPIFDQLINEMVGILDPAAGRVAVLNDLVSSKGRVYDQLDSEYATAHPGLDTATGIYPADSSTNTPAREDATFTAMRRDQLKRLADWQAEVVAKLKRARQVIDMLIPRLQKAIDIRNKQIAAVQEYIRNNQATIKSYRYLLSLLPNTTKALTAKDHSKVDGLAKLLANEAHGSMRSNLLGVLRSGVTGQRARSNVSANITALQDQNKQLSGTGGIIDVLGGPSGQISVLQERIKTASDNRAQIVGPSGEGGTLLDAQLTLNDFVDQLKPFDPAAVAAAIAASNATLTGPGTTAADNSQALADLAEQNRLQGILNTQLRQQLAVSEAQGKVFANATDLFPFIGKFAAGGTWPQTGWGLVGEHGPELALLPGGSKILNNNQTSQIGVQPTIVVQVLDGAVDAKRIRVLAGDEAQAAIRGSSRSGGRILPGGAR